MENESNSKEVNFSHRDERMTHVLKHIIFLEREVSSEITFFLNMCFIYKFIIITINLDIESTLSPTSTTMTFNTLIIFGFLIVGKFL